MNETRFHHIKLDGVGFSYPTHRVLTDVTFTVPAGVVVGLIGENGSGKSTLISLISKKQHRDTGTITRPPVTGFMEQETALPFSAPAQELIDAAVAELRGIEADITRISEEMAQGNDAPELAATFDAALARAQETGVWELDARIQTVLAGLGLEDVELSTPLGEMSGGQRRRFAMAALLLRPVDAMVLDEPTNHLDDDAVDFLISELENFSGPVLVASHDRYFLDEAADEIVDMDPALGPEGSSRQDTVFGGGFSDYLKERHKARTLWRQRYNAQEQERERLQSRANQTGEDIFHHVEAKSETRMARKYAADRAAKTLGNRVRAAQSRLERLTAHEIPRPPAPLRFNGLPETTLTSLGEPAIAARSVTVAGRLDPVSIKVQPGQHLLVEGANGAGKSTFLSVIEGRVQPTAGEVRIPDGVRIARLNQDDAWPDLQLSAAAAYAARLDAGLSRPPSLTDLGLLSEEQASRPLSQLSIGQRRRVALGAILASPPDILLLDEPTNHLSLLLAEELEKALEQFEGTIVMATHDRWVRRRWKGKILHLEPATRKD
ncbi:ABC transporter ATPase [Corynebacterium atypicum]|uniref:ABC transporter ATPase n=1 Tax=Corynebacterium atypicum TaxID=191610 RepID=A0ABM5QNQ3_9CORY|nr:ABC-F family ATP-binding cassette domain-containing protein [Corynebacterium atypicum]AIG64416.1 ABC transporter ATPase [Corynebacterium atypicum]